MFNQFYHAARWEIDFQSRKGAWRLWTDRCDYYIRMIYPDERKAKGLSILAGRYERALRELAPISKIARQALEKKP